MNQNKSDAPGTPEMLAQVMETSTQAETLAKACAGLLFPSETDAPITPLAWSREQMPVLTPETLFTPEALRTHLGLPATASVQQTTAADFFAGYDPAQGDPADPQQQKTLSRLQALKDVLTAQLTGLTVFRVGNVAIDIYILGLTPQGDVAGVQTKAVET